VLSAAFAILAHAALVDGVPRPVGAVLSLVPLAVLAAWAVRRTRHRAALIAVLALGAIGLALAWGGLVRHFPDIFFLEHAGTNLALSIVFGRTLAAGREPLCTRFARIVHGDLPPEVQRYSRQLTVAWTIFFATLFMLSCTLYLGGFREAWSLLANFLTAALVVAMFAIEYAVRLRMLPNWNHVGVMGGVRAFSRHFADSRAGARR
jgi:uncharacterized membrane protein